MTESKIEMYVPMSLPAAVVRDAMLEVMPLIAQGTPPYDTVSLSVALRDIKIGLPGTMNVPIRARAETRPIRWECALEISAARDETFFPRFRGTLTVTPSTNTTSELWLQGGYEAPMGKTGAALDATILRGAAERSLKTFLEWLAKELRTHAIEREKRSNEEARGRHGGA